MAGPTRWLNPLPVYCQMCGAPLKSEEFYDTKIRGDGRWAVVCETDFRIYGSGLGTGRGQRYAADGTKLEG